MGYPFPQELWLVLPDFRRARRRMQKNQARGLLPLNLGQSSAFQRADELSISGASWRLAKDNRPYNGAKVWRI